MTELIGWAIPIETEGPLAALDHTYVTSTDGMAWGCWGRSSGGREICRGPGDQGIADCLSQPVGSALIVYSLTGVCHQTANRILRSARQTVCQAQAYAASWALYGAYGGSNRVLDPAWKGHEAICGLWDWRPDPFWLEANAAPDPYFEAVQAAHAAMTDAVRQNRATEQEAMHEVSRAELDALVSNRVVTGLAAGTLESLARSRADMLAELTPPLLAASGPVAMTDAAERANRLVNDFLVSAAQSLTAEEFKSLFDVAPGTRVVVALPEVVKAWTSGQLQGTMRTKAVVPTR